MTCSRPTSLSNLDLAWQARYARAEMKRAVRSGDRTVADVLTDPGELFTVSIEAVLTAQHYWGPQKAGYVCGRARLEPNRAIGTLTDPQRARLIEEVHP